MWAFISCRRRIRLSAPKVLRTVHSLRPVLHQVPAYGLWPVLHQVPSYGLSYGLRPVLQMPAHGQRTVFQLPTYGLRPVIQLPTTRTQSSDEKMNNCELGISNCWMKRRLLPRLPRFNNKKT